jgi:hypothetical protein
MAKWKRTAKKGEVQREEKKRRVIPLTEVAQRYGVEQPQGAVGRLVHVTVIVEG